MKKIWMLCFVALLSLGGAALAQAQSGATEKAVIALENKWLESQQKNNPDLVAPLLADKVVETSADGKVSTKSQMLATAKATKYDGADYEDLKVTVFGNTAIATGGFKGKVTDGSGKSTDVHVRWTDTWVKMPSGKWQCVATQASTIK
jgi:ketosteroid isomerase-like protein